MDKPSTVVTDSAKNPEGQRSTMSNMPVGTPSFGNPELNSAAPKIISPTSTMGHNSLECGGGKKC